MWLHERKQSNILKFGEMNLRNKCSVLWMPWELGPIKRHPDYDVGLHNNVSLGNTTLSTFLSALINRFHCIDSQAINRDVHRLLK